MLEAGEVAGPSSSHPSSVSGLADSPGKISLIAVEVGFCYDSERSANLVSRSICQSPVPVNTIWPFLLTPRCFPRA